MSQEFFIQKSIKHPGELRQYSEEHGLLKRNRTIDLFRATEYIKKHETGEKRVHLLRTVNLARTLQKIRPKGTRRMERLK